MQILKFWGYFRGYFTNKTNVFGYNIIVKNADRQCLLRQLVVVTRTMLSRIGKIVI